MTGKLNTNERKTRGKNKLIKTNRQVGLSTDRKESISIENKLTGINILSGHIKIANQWNSVAVCPLVVLNSALVGFTLLAYIKCIYNCT